MAYTLNIIQRVSDGYILGSCGCSFIPITTQAAYKNALFITGDAQDIPDSYSGLANGEYRVLSFLTYGEYGQQYPAYQGQTFGNIVDGPNANNVNIVMDGEGRFFTSPPFGAWFTFVSNYYGNGQPASFFVFNADQVNNNGLDATRGSSFAGERGFPSAYTNDNYFFTEIFELDYYNGSVATSTTNPYSNLNVLFFSV